MVVTTKIQVTSRVFFIYNKNPTRPINLTLSHKICHKLLLNIHYPQIEHSFVNIQYLVIGLNIHHNIVIRPKMWFDIEQPKLVTKFVKNKSAKNYQKRLALCFQNWILDNFVIELKVNLQKSFLSLNNMISMCFFALNSLRVSNPKKLYPRSIKNVVTYFSLILCLIL